MQGEKKEKKEKKEKEKEKSKSDDSGDKKQKEGKRKIKLEGTNEQIFLDGNDVSMNGVNGVEHTSLAIVLSPSGTRIAQANLHFG